MARKLVVVAAVVVAVAACGTREPDRTTGGAATGAATSPQDVNLGRPVWSNPEVRTPLGDNRRGRSATRARAGDRQTAESRREPRDERDRAYMGGGMVGTGTGAGTSTTAPAAGTGTTAPATTGTAGSGNQPGTGGTSQTR